MNCLLNPVFMSFWYAYWLYTNKLKIMINKSFFKVENYGGEFSIHNTYNPSRPQKFRQLKAKMYTVFLYVLALVSIVMWVTSLNILPFGHIFQFLLGSAVLFTNVLIFKWVRL